MAAAGVFGSPASGALVAHIRLFALAFVLLFLSHPCHAQYSFFSFEYNVTDISPLFKWGLPRVHPEWSTNFTNVSAGLADPYTLWSSPFNYTGPVGWGDSYHTVQPPQNLTAELPRLVLTTESTGVRIKGTRTPDTTASASAGGVEYSVDKSAWDNSSDSVTSTTTPGTLLSLDRLPWGMHTFVMKPKDPTRAYTVSGATVRTQLLSKASSWDQVPVTHEWFVINQTRNPRLIYMDSESSRWHAENRRSEVNYGPAIVTELVAGNSSKVVVPIPPGTAFVLVNGTVGPDRGEALIDWDPKPPYFPPEGWYLNATCGWSAPALLYAKYLDPDVVYNLTIHSLSRELHSVTEIGLHMLTYYSAWPREPKSSEDAAAATGTKSDRGRVIGGVVGGVLGALALAAIFALLWFQRRRRSRSSGPEEIPLDQDYRASPFMQEVDAGSIHSTSSSMHHRALPPSYNPQWSTRVRPDGAGAGEHAASSTDILSAPPLSPGVGPSGGFFKLSQASQPPAAPVAGVKASPAAASSSTALADYKRPYLTMTFNRPDIATPVESAPGPVPRLAPTPGPAPAPAPVLVGGALTPGGVSQPSSSGQTSADATPTTPRARRPLPTPPRAAPR